MAELESYILHLQGARLFNQMTCFWCTGKALIFPMNQNKRRKLSEDDVVLNVEDVHELPKEDMVIRLNRLVLSA